MINSVYTNQVSQEGYGKKLARSFSKLMFHGNIDAAIQLLPQHCRGGVLHVENSIDLGDQGVNSVLDTICSKHPNATRARPEALMMGNADPPLVLPVVHDQITASCIRCGALCAKAAGEDAVLFMPRGYVPLLSTQKTSFPAGFRLNCTRQVSWHMTYWNW